MPTSGQLSEFKARVVAARGIPKQVVDMLRLIPTDAPAMDVLRTGVSMLAHFDPEANVSGHDANLRKAERLLAQIPTLIASRNRLKNGSETITACRDLRYAVNLTDLYTGQALD